MLVDNRSDSALLFAMFLNKSMSHSLTANISLLQTFSVACVCISMTQAAGKELIKLDLTVFNAGLSEK